MQQLVNIDETNIILHLIDNLNFCLPKVYTFFSIFKSNDEKIFLVENL